MHTQRDLRRPAQAHSLGSALGHECACKGGGQGAPRRPEERSREMGSAWVACLRHRAQVLAADARKPPRGRQLGGHAVIVPVVGVAALADFPRVAAALVARLARTRAVVLAIGVVSAAIAVAACTATTAAIGVVGVVFVVGVLARIRCGVASAPSVPRRALKRSKQDEPTGLPPAEADRGSRAVHACRGTRGGVPPVQNELLGLRARGSRSTRRRCVLLRLGST
mmetsp:Transcript_23229/g.59718  ORF Transcript_23229/g.59718 Transcript_23229/m.59718 type:complete len:224 (+) Transcript_23229:1573-2244(+)